MNISLKIRHEGGDAEDGRLDLYDGTTSIQGFAQSLNIATHAYINSSLIKRATALKGAKLYIKSARKGSFVSEILILMEQHPATTGFIAAYTANAFYDFLKVVFQKATGVFSDDEVETASVRRALEREEPFFDELAEILEGSLQRAHRPIGNGVNTISLERPRSELVNFDIETKNWVETREETPFVENLTGNVTRYNSITKNGRAYIEKLDKIIPFRVGEDYPFNRYGVLTWSLHGSNSGSGGSPQLPKKITLSASQVLSANHNVKRLILSDAFPAESTENTT